jgi:hypothetical protein
MPIATRNAQIVGEEPLASGTAMLPIGSGALGRLAVTWASRTDLLLVSTALRGHVEISMRSELGQ